MGRSPSSKKAAAAKKKAASENGTTTARGAPRKEGAKAAAVLLNISPTPQEKRAALDQYSEIKRSIASLSRQARTVLKDHEAQGGDGKMIMAMWKLESLTSGEAEAHVARYFEYARDIGIRVHFETSGQGALTDMLASPGAAAPSLDAEAALQAARAYSDGYNSGRNGAAPSDNPHHPGTEPYIKWHNGRDDGQREKEGKPVAGAKASASKHPTF